MKFKGVLFDLDGTIIDTSDLILETFHQTAQQFLGKDIPDSEITKSFGLPLRECLAALDAERVEEMVAFYRDYNMRKHDELIKPFPHIEETLIALQQKGIPCAIVTSKKKPTALRGLRCFNLEKYFTGIIGCDECTKHKPDAEPMHRGLELLGLAGSECLCVGDSPYDLLSGKANGCTTVAVSWSRIDKAVFTSLIKPDYIVDKMTDLLPLFK